MPDRASADDRSGDDPRRGGATALDGPIPGLPMALAARLRHALAARPAIVCAWLFGSRARGGARPDSDIDIAVLLIDDPSGRLPDSAIALAGELEDEIGASLDLVIANRAPPDLVHRVMRDGVLLLDRAPGKRIAFEVAARNRWFDLQPVLATYRSPTGTGHGRR